MTLRRAPLRAAVALAAAFVAVRVVYRVLFHGVDGPGAVIVDLPDLRLAPPFGHVVMFGPVTAGGIADAVVSALPIALTILAFGVVNALVDLPRLFASASRRGPFQGIARAFAVAWATLPALADAVRRVRTAHRLRGERIGVRLLSPVLERTLERAMSVAAALELRGFAGRGLEGACRAPVEMHAATASRAGEPVVHIPALTLAPRSLTLVAGATGSGKSTLLHAIAGVHSHLDGGELDGVVRIVGHDRVATPPRDLARRVGVVAQSPRTGFATDRVADEIALALELRGVVRDLVDARVHEVAARVGVTALLGRELRTLSAGEATLVAIAAAIVEHPILLLVDEPLADLDRDARVRITRLLDELAHDAGMCVVVAEHRVDELVAIADACLRIRDGVLEHGEPVHTAIRPTRRPVATGVPALHVAGLSVRRDGRTLVADARFDIDGGEVLALIGPNGAGKSTLLTALALPEANAPISVGDATGRRPSPGVALVPDASDDLFLRDTVRAECARADRRARRRGAVARDTASRFAALLGIDPRDDAWAHLLSAHPRDLSVGERRCLAVAVQTATAPRVLLIDEPTRGLDEDARDLVAAAIDALAAAGTAVVFATHDGEFADAVADRVIRIDDGTLSSPGAGGRGAETPRRRDLDGDSLLRTAPAARGRTSRTRQATAEAAAPLLGLSRPAARGALVAANLIAAAAFAWPLVAAALPAQSGEAAGYVALALTPLAALLVLLALDRSVRSAHVLALLGTLAAIGAAVRIVGTGVGGVEAVFILLILAGRAFGARFGLLLGLLTIGVSSLLWGGIGPWTPFQMFACAWVGAGAGLLPRRVRGAAEAAMIAAYGVVAAYAFGLVMNLWFWPFAVGGGTGISYVPGAPIGQNLSSFLLYSLLTSTAGWDTLRAVTTVVGVVAIGRPVLAALRRASAVTTTPRAARSGSAAGDVPGRGGRRTVPTR